MGAVVGRSLAEQKVITYAKMMQKSEGLWNSILVFLGALSLLSAIPFYPLPVAFFIALLAGGVAFKYPHFGVLLGFVAALPSLAYQSTILGWLGLLLLAIVLFEMFDNWGVVALLEVVCLAPFAAFPLSLFSGFVYLLMVWGSLHFGSRKSVIVSVPAVLIILLLSASWLVQNSAYLPITQGLYAPGMNALMVSRPAVGLGEIAGAVGPALGNAFNFMGTKDVFPALGKIWDNFMRLIFMDFGLFQIIVWAAALYLVGWLSGTLKGRWAQTMSAAALLLVPLLYFAMSLVLRFPFRAEMVFYAAASVAVVGALDFAGIKISRERALRAEERMRKFGKFGMEAVRPEETMESLEDIGGYEGLKKELRDAIVTPLREKELAEAYGLKPPSGVLLFGPPGTGKTMLMRALAKELGFAYTYVKSSDIMSMWVGESLPYDEKILIKDENGKIGFEKIGKIVEEKRDVRVLSFDEKGKASFSRIKKHIKHRCSSPIYEVRTKTGRKIRVTKYHSLFTYKNGRIESVATSELVPESSSIAVTVGGEGLDAVTDDIYLDRVEEIRRVGDEEFVYDIAVEPCQNFVAGFGGIFAHNSEKNVAEVFENARKAAPSILFFDEIDAMAKKRTEYTADDVAPRVLSVFLQEMDGFAKAKKPVIVVGATNAPNKLDPALMRPGRFDKIIYMPLPDYEARKAIFRVHLSKIPATAPDVDLDLLAKKTERYSGADIKNVVSEAMNVAAQDAMAQKKIVPVGMSHLLKVLEFTKPSTTFAQLEEYDLFKVDFERSMAREARPPAKEEKKLKWGDVADLEDVKRAFREAIEIPLLHPELMEQYKVRPARGILMFGPPGCGKTLVVKAAADEMGIVFLTVSGAQLMKQGYGHAVNVIKETFNRARENPPAVIFVDEIETVAPAREAGRSDIVGQFLTEMDGLKELRGVMVVGATNKPFLLDPAILRPGRFDKIFYVHPPDAKGREQLFAIHLGEFAKGLDLEKLARLSEGFSGADIASLAQEVKMYMVRERIAGREPRIDTERVLQMLSMRRPSITHEALMEYEAFLREYGERH